MVVMVKVKRDIKTVLLGVACLTLIKKTAARVADNDVTHIPAGADHVLKIMATG